MLKIDFIEMNGMCFAIFCTLIRFSGFAKNFGLGSEAG